MLYVLFEEAEAVDFIKKSLRGPSPLHVRRTLEQFRHWPLADDTDQQDAEQTVRQEILRQRRYRPQDQLHTIASPSVIVDQLWIWILDHSE
jgi:hypothetical protein